LLKIDDFEPFEISYEFPPLLEGIYLERLNRFTGSLKFENRIVNVHIPNSGRLQEVLKKGRKAYFSPKKGLKTEGFLQLIKEG